ncbi:hypothetical protein BJX62DRAFT_223082 [Aspergillus germanicus]
MPMGSNSAIGNVLGDTTPSFLGLIRESRMAGCVAVPTQIPSVHAMSDLNENHPRAIVNQQSSILSPTSVPSRVAEFLLFTYTTGIIAQCPIFSEDEAKNAFEVVLSVGFNSPDCDSRNVYIVSLIMAISLSTAARNKLTRAQSLATALFKNAMLHISTVMTNDLPGLQALLLLIHYTFLNPTVGNLWLLTGISSEACIEMGLHQELTASMDDLALDQRRRIFWCAWEMEVAVSAAFRRPIRTLNKYISASFPNCPQSPSPALHSIAIFIWRFRQLEAELISILYSNDPLPPEASPLENWMASMENKVCDWAQEVQESAARSDCPSTKNQWCEMVLYADIAYHHCLVLLYGPSNRVKTPTRSNIKRAFQASVRVAVGYWEQANTEFGRIKYTFHTCYHTFSAAVVFLRVLRSCKSDITQLFTLTELEDCASCFVRILSSIGERWPAAARCLEEFNHLLSPIMKSYSDFFLFAQHDDLLQQETQDPFQTASFFAEAFDVLDYENFIQFFNPPPGVVEGSLPTPPAVIPFDWDIEFEFGMNELPVDGLDFT